MKKTNKVSLVATVVTAGMLFSPQTALAAHMDTAKGKVVADSSEIAAWDEEKVVYDDLKVGTETMKCWVLNMESKVFWDFDEYCNYLNGLAKDSLLTKTGAHADGYVPGSSEIGYYRNDGVAGWVVVYKSDLNDGMGGWKAFWDFQEYKSTHEKPKNGSDAVGTPRSGWHSEWVKITTAADGSRTCQHSQLFYVDQDGNRYTIDEYNKHIDYGRNYDGKTYQMKYPKITQQLSPAKSGSHTETVHHEAQTVWESGWVDISGTKAYIDPTTHEALTDWQKIDGTWYDLGEDGLFTGETSATNPNGRDPNTWYKAENGKWHLTDANGEDIVGKTAVWNGKTYGFNAAGENLIGWKKIGGVWYYFNKDGSGKNGWLKSGSKWYYFNAGKMKVGWQKASGAWYYFGANGVMYANKGVWSGGWYYWFKGSGKMAAAEWIGMNYYDGAGRRTMHYDYSLGRWVSK